MGEHKDNEPELDPNTPIASLSLGQNRDFVFRHGDCRKKGSDKRKLPPGIYILYIYFYFTSIWGRLFYMWSAINT